MTENNPLFGQTEMSSAEQHSHINAIIQQSTNLLSQKDLEISAALQLLHQVTCSLKSIANENAILRKELEKKSETVEKLPTPMQTNLQNIQYYTDEETLEEEVGWIEVENSRKKRKKPDDSSPEPEKIEVQKNNKNQITEKRPPPIWVENVINHKAFVQELEKSLTKNAYTLKTTTNNNVKISCFTETAYRTATSVLNKTLHSYHTYENKQKRPIRVMAKGLHHSWPVNDVYGDLKERGYNIENAVNKLSWKEKKPLDMFILSFDHNENPEKIHKITHILNTKVEIHPMRGSKIIPQCKKCQAFEHTQKYCNRNPRCVKCAGNHLTQLCTKPSETKATCANCNSDHPANYRGCQVAKQLQQLRSTQNKIKKIAEPTPEIRSEPVNKKMEQQKENHNVQNVVDLTSQQPISYSNTSKQGLSTTNLVEEMLQKIISKLNQLEIQCNNMDQRLKKIENHSSSNNKTKTQKCRN